MNNTIKLSSNTIDISTLQELRDPNLISRYPPLYNRKQNLISIDNKHHITQDQIKHGNSNSSSGRMIPLQSFSSYQDSLISKQSKTSKKRYRFLHFFTGFSKHNIKLTKQELLKQSISKPLKATTERTSSRASIDSIYMNSLFPTKKSNTIKIKKDSLEEMDYTRQEIKRKDTFLSQLKYQAFSPPSDSSAIHNIVIPPIGSNYSLDHSEVPRFTNRIIHPNLSVSPQREVRDDRIRRRKNIHEEDPEEFGAPGYTPTFIRYDLMNLNNSNNGFSPIEDDYARFVPNTNSPYLIESSFLPTTVSSDSNESYYSFVKSEEKIEQPETRIRKVTSPIYRITRNSPSQSFFTSYDERLESNHKHTSRNRI